MKKQISIALLILSVIINGCFPMAQSIITPTIEPSQAFVLTPTITIPTNTPVRPTSTPTIAPSPSVTPTSSYICLLTKDERILLACYFYGAIIAGMYEVADAKYTCQSRIIVASGKNTSFAIEAAKYLETYFNWQGERLEQVVEQNAEGNGKWYQLQFKGITGTIYHRLFIGDFKGKPCIDVEKTTGIPIPTPSEP